MKSSVRVPLSNNNFIVRHLLHYYVFMYIHAYVFAYMCEYVWSAFINTFYVDDEVGTTPPSLYTFSNWVQIDVVKFVLLCKYTIRAYIDERRFLYEYVLFILST